MYGYFSLTKYAHFCALSHPFKAYTVSSAFMETIQKLHGNLKIIVSDRDRIFTGNFWTELFSSLSIQLAHILSYHPQSDWQTEVVNKCWKDIFVALYLINRHNGLNGCLQLNGGITLPSIQQQK